MPSVSDFLRRFRPVVAPGRPARAGVPADRVAERTAELAPIFEGLQDREHAAQRLVADARADADERRAAAETERVRLLAQAREDAHAARAHAAAAVVPAVEEDRRSSQADAEQRAAELGREAAGELPGLVDRIVASVAEAGTDTGPRR
jgi:vacuolar-type H+-ATPase subunit H